MTCIPINNGYVCGVSVGLYGRRILACPTCSRRRRMLVRFGGIWYSDTITCLSCGDSWSDGERHERPFMPGWREKAKQSAQTHYYRDAVNRDEYRREVRTISDAYWQAA